MSTKDDVVIDNNTLNNKTIIKEGYLIKQSKFIKKWNLRLFILLKVS